MPVEATADTSTLDNPPLPAFLTQPLTSIYEKFDRIEEHGEAIISQDDSLSSDPVVVKRNRYLRVYPFNHNRVEICDVDEHEHPYINASRIDLGRKEEFIATQGPLDDEFGRFWRLVWQEGIEVVVMLTQPREKGLEMCAVYYPQQIGEAREGDMGMRVECLSLSKESETEVRKLRVSKGEEEKYVWHFFYPNWPDMTAPEKEEQQAVLNLIKMSRFRLDGGQGGPRLVHCSAGVGRTGTFITLDHLLQEMVRWKKGGVVEDDLVFECVKKLREQRMKTVYKKEQYAFIYQVLREQWET
jgi:protein-tyrosine phosphatase